ncbi:MAG: DUF5686 family protein, partial [Rikenellaceae bacterium]
MKLTFKNVLYKISLLSLLAILVSTKLFASNEGYIKGCVNSIDDDTPILGAIITDHNARGTMSDDKGMFTIKVDKLPVTLKITYLGYATQEVKVKDFNEPVIIHLQSNNVIDQVVVKAKRRIKKDEYSWFLHKKIVAKAEENNPSNISPITYSDYERTSVFRLKNNKSHDQSDTTSSKFIHVPFMVGEKLVYVDRDSTLTNETRKTISENSNTLYERMSPHILSVLDEKVVVDINFYDNQITLLGRGFPSPLSPNASLNYRLYVTDSLYVNGRKQYQFQYFPKSKKSTTFKGEFWVDSLSWGVTSISAELPAEANLNFISNFKISTEYQPTRDGQRWFKKNLSTQLDFSILGEGQSDQGGLLLFNVKRLNSYNLLDQTEMSRESTPALGQALIALERIKAPMDSLNLVANKSIAEAKGKWHNKVLDEIFKATITSYFNMGYIDYGPYYTTYRKTVVEGSKFTLPLRTSEKLFKNFTIGGFIGYGTDIKEYSYGSNLKYRVPTQKRLILSADYSKDYFNLSNNRFWEFIYENAYDSGTGSFVASFTSFNPNPYMLGKRSMSVGAQYTISDDFELLVRPTFERFTANIEGLHYTPHILFKQGDKYFDYFETKSLLLNFRFSKDRRFDEDYFERIFYGNSRPVIHLSLLAGEYSLQGVEQSKPFANVNLSLRQRVNMGRVQLNALLLGGV